MEIYDNIRQVQLIQINMLKDIISLCENNSIEYFIIGGTALGAVRHKGFIPWDDDIDLGMTRDNYEKFLELAGTLLGTEYYVQEFRKDVKCPFSFTKVRKNDTLFIEEAFRKVKMHHGIYIDVFPIDNIPDSDKLRRQQFERIQKLEKILYYKYYNNNSDINSIRKLISIIIGTLKNTIYRMIPQRILVYLINKELRQYNQYKTKIKGLISYPNFMKLTFDERTLYPLKKIEFEGIMVYAPNDIDKYLTNQYNNYMELPSEEHRIGHRPFLIKV